MRTVLIRVLAAQLVLACAVRAQAPTGAIAGVITDPDGAAVPATRVTITNRDTKLKRALVTAADGEYSVPALLAGVYEVTAEAPGFKRLERQAIVEAGSTTTVNLALSLGANTETVTVAAV